MMGQRTVRLAAAYRRARHRRQRRPRSCPSRFIRGSATGPSSRHMDSGTFLSQECSCAPCAAAGLAPLPAPAAKAATGSWGDRRCRGAHCTRALRRALTFAVLDHMLLIVRLERVLGQVERSWCLSAVHLRSTNNNHERRRVRRGVGAPSGQMLDGSGRCGNEYCQNTVRVWARMPQAWPRIRCGWPRSVIL